MSKQSWSSASMERVRALLEQHRANREDLMEELRFQGKMDDLKTADEKAADEKAAEQKAADEKATEDAAFNASWIQALGKDAFEKRENIKVPHLLNLNPDERLTEKLIYTLKQGLNFAGRRNKDNKTDLDFSGAGLGKDHCALIWVGNTVKLVNTNFLAWSFVNGVPVEDEGDELELKHNDRVWLGHNSAFRFAFPGQEDKAVPLPDGFKNLDYFLAESEVMRKDSTIKEMEEQIEELRALLQERKANEEALKEDMTRQIEEVRKQAQDEKEAMRQQMQKEIDELKKNQKE